MADNVGLQFFPNASGFGVHGGEFYQAQNMSFDRGRRLNGFEILLQNICCEAFHNSDHQFDPPKCHPNTRVAVLKRITEWVDDPGSNNIMWLYGPAGAGKSAIARTISEQLERKNKLAASFFFSRTANRSGRDSAARLIATISYQLSIALPYTRDLIAKAVENDPTLFSRSLETQIQCLIVNPLLSSRKAENDEAKLVVLDGLDECKDEKVQHSILKSISAVLLKHRLPLCFLISSRPEPHIRGIFNERELCGILTSMALDDSFHPDRDIWIFLRSKFHELKQKHILQQYIPEVWPSPTAIDTIVERSSGQFIYAATVVNYVSDPDRHPDSQLEIILGMTSPQVGDTPFAQLDMLYKHLMSTVRNEKLTLRILGVILPDLNPRGASYLPLIEGILSLKYGAAELALSRLHSVLAFRKVRNDMKEVYFCHKSLPDFLVDRSRSGEYFIDYHQVHEDLARCYLHHLTSGAIAERHLDIRQVHRRSNQYCCPQHCTFDEAINTHQTDTQLAKQCWDRCNSSRLAWCNIRVLCGIIRSSTEHFLQHLSFLNVRSSQIVVDGIDPFQFVKSLFESNTVNRIFSDLPNVISVSCISAEKLEIPPLHAYYQFRSGFEQCILNMLETYPQGSELLIFIAGTLYFSPKDNVPDGPEWIFSILDMGNSTDDALIDADKVGLGFLHLPVGHGLLHQQTLFRVWLQTFFDDLSRAGKYHTGGDVYGQVTSKFLKYLLKGQNVGVERYSENKADMYAEILCATFQFISKASLQEELAICLCSIDFNSRLCHAILELSFLSDEYIDEAQEKALAYLQKYNKFCKSKVFEANPLHLRVIKHRQIQHGKEKRISSESRHHGTRKKTKLVF